MQDVSLTPCITLTPGERRLLLEDIARIGLLLGRHLEPSDDAQPGVALSLQEGDLSSGESSALERLALLSASWPEVKAAVMGVTRQPDSGLASVSNLVPLARSRGLPCTGRALARTPRGANLWRATMGGTYRHTDADRQPVPEQTHRLTTNTIANRCVATLLEIINAEAEALARLAAFCDAHDDAGLAQTLANNAAALRVQPPLGALVPLDRSAAQRFFATDALLRCPPPYLVLARLWRNLASYLHFDWSGSPLLRLPVLEAWHLYEIWCFMQTAASLAATGWRLVGGDAIRWRASGLRLELLTGQSSCLRFRRVGHHECSVELYYQPYFPSANRMGPGNVSDNYLHRSVGCAVDKMDLDRDTDRGYRNEGGIFGIASRSHVMQPDIALAYRGRLFLLDAKFRDYGAPERECDSTGLPGRFASRQLGALQEDIDKMHTYRDALHRDGACVVQGAWTLFPGAAEGVASYAYPEARPDQPYGTAGVGAVRLRPGDTNQALKGLLTWWLAQ